MRKDVLYLVDLERQVAGSLVSLQRSSFPCCLTFESLALDILGCSLKIRKKHSEETKVKNRKYERVEKCSVSGKSSNELQKSVGQRRTFLLSGGGGCSRELA